MKRILFTFLATLFLINTIGINVYAHFCGGQLAQTSIISPVTGCCELPVEETDCCESEQTYLQLEADFVSFKNSISLDLPEFSSFIKSSQIHTNATKEPFVSSFTKVSFNTPPINILHQVFII